MTEEKKSYARGCMWQKYREARDVPYTYKITSGNEPFVKYFDIFDIIFDSYGGSDLIKCCMRMCR